MNVKVLDGAVQAADLYANHALARRDLVEELRTFLLYAFLPSSIVESR